MDLPIFPLNTVLFPGVPLPLRVFEDRYLRMLSDRMTSDPMFGISLIASGREVGDNPAFHRIGTSARLVSLNAQSSHLVDLVVVGDRRIRMSSGQWTRGYAVAETEPAPDREYDSAEATSLLQRADRLYRAWLKSVERLLGTTFDTPALGTNPVAAGFALASQLPLHTWDQQAFLEDDDPLSRLRTVCRWLEREVGLIRRGGVAGIPIPHPGNRFTLN